MDQETPDVFDSVSTFILPIYIPCPFVPVWGGS